MCKYGKKQGQAELVCVYVVLYVSWGNCVYDSDSCMAVFTVPDHLLECKKVLIVRSSVWSNGLSMQKHNVL